jgi:hypothetical protein
VLRDRPTRDISLSSAHVGTSRTALTSSCSSSTLTNRQPLAPYSCQQRTKSRIKCQDPTPPLRHPLYNYCTNMHPYIPTCASVNHLGCRAGRTTSHYSQLNRTPQLPYGSACPSQPRTSHAHPLAPSKYNITQPTVHCPLASQLTILHRDPYVCHTSTCTPRHR